MIQSAKHYGLNHNDNCFSIQQMFHAANWAKRSQTFLNDLVNMIIIGQETIQDISKFLC